MAFGAVLSRLLWSVNRSPAAPLVTQFFRERGAENVRERKRLAQNLQTPPLCIAAADALNRDGFALIDDIVDRSLSAQLASHCDDKVLRASAIASKQEITKKAFWTRLLDEDLCDGAFLPTSLPVQVAIQAPIISMLTHAFGEIPQLSDVIVTLSQHSNEDLAYSQLWHRDYDSSRTIKVFVYLSDVTTLKDGPFTFLPAPVSAPVGFTIRSHMHDEALFRRVNRDDVKHILGPRLTAFVVETSRCLHMGSRLAAGHQRLMYAATFIKAPRPYPEPPPRFRVGADADPVTLKVLSR